MHNSLWVGGSIGRRGFPMLGTGKRGLSTYVKELFKNNEQGFFYDPNDLSTMFQNTSGTIPVTAVGQPVGLVLDKSKGVVLGSELLKPFTDSNWQLSGGITVDGGLLHFTNAVDGASAVYVNLSHVSERFYVLEFDYVSYTSGGGVYARIGSGGFTAIPTNTSGHKKVILRAGPTGNFIQLAEGVGGGNYTIGNVSIKEIYGNHAYQTTFASRPILRKNAVTGANYLEFDGTDDFLVANNIDFTATDKVSLFAGVTNLKDTVAIIAELSAIVNLSVNSGSFYLVSGSDVDVTGYTSVSRGLASADITQAAKASPYLAPNTSVLSVKHDISGNLSTIKVNGVKGVDGTGNKGAGNFGNYPLFIGRRGGANLPFNGHVYSLIGVGKLVSDNETTAIEKELAKRTGATLNV